jgi:hypothetical protein
MNLKFLITLLLAVFTASAAQAASPATAALVPSSSHLLPGGGTVTFTANVAGYPGPTTAIGWTVNLPAGWSYVSGNGEPDVKPVAGTVGTLEWAYVSIPTDASFSFTVAYPAGITSKQTVTSAVIVRVSGHRQNVTPEDVSFSTASIPVITNTDPAAATYGSTLSFNIEAESPIEIMSYDATGLPSGLTRSGATISGAPTQTGSFPVTLSATNAAGTATKSITLTVNAANATIELGNLSHTYNGSPKSATAQTNPAGLPVVITYDGNTTPPTDAGSYAVTATIDSTTHTATASGTLKIAQAEQTVSFADPGTVPPDQSVTLAASSSAGLPIAFQLISGSATIDGSTLTINGTGTVVVRATAAGNTNYKSAFAERTINSSKKQQTISFASIPNKIATDPAFKVTATASSGLPVTFTIMSGGPAIISGNTITLTGRPGSVTVRASQSGDSSYFAAEDVFQSFDVVAENHRVFFGEMFFQARGALVNTQENVDVQALAAPIDDKVGEIAAVLPSQSKTGSLLFVAPTVNVNAIANFTLADDNTFTTTVQQGGATPTMRTVRGELSGNYLSGTIEGTGISFATEVEPRSGPSVDVAGLYLSSALDTAQGTTYSVIGSSNNVLVLVVSPTLTIGGTTTLQSNRTFQLQVANGGEMITLQGSVDAATATVSGTILVPNQAPIEFAGLEVSATRTDRLFGLSSRGRVGTGEKILVSGVVIGGNEPKRVLIRAIGPSLAPMGVTGVLADPHVRLFKGTTAIGENDDWGSNPNAEEVAEVARRVGAFGVTTGSKDAMMLATLEPGAYTVHVSGGEGVALADIYDASENPQAEYQRLIDIATRGEVGTGDNVLIGGLVITGNSPKKVLIRGVGPGLAAQGITAPLADPVLKVFKRSEQIAQNDNWSADASMAEQIKTAAEATGAFQLQAGSKDAALLMTLAPGHYTVHVTGANNTTGIALVEIYEVAE